MKQVNPISSFAIPLTAGTEIRPQNVKELAAAYRVSKKTFKRWLKPFEAEIGSRAGNYYSIMQVKTIFTLLGMPGSRFVEVEEG